MLRVAKAGATAAEKRTQTHTQTQTQQVSNGNAHEQQQTQYTHTHTHTHTPWTHAHAPYTYTPWTHTVQLANGAYHHNASSTSSEVEQSYRSASTSFESWEDRVQACLVRDAQVNLI
jgi:hypothetical protein